MIIGTYLYSYVAKDCGSLKIPLNGSLIGPNITTFPNSLTFSCDRGFALKGSRVRSCQANEIWSGNETLCQGNDIIYIFRVHSLTAGGGLKSENTLSAYAWLGNVKLEK